MANLNTVPKQLKQPIGDMMAEMSNLMFKLSDGKISVDKWRELMARLITKNHLATAMIGLNDLEIPEELLNAIRLSIEDQLVYLDIFANDLRMRPDYFPVWRAEMYALSPLTSYDEAKVFKRYGRMIPFPAMPKQGTQCHTNCGCKWRVVEIDKEKGDFNCFWERHKDDSCQTCLQREEDWYPIEVRDWMLQL